MKVDGIRTNIAFHERLLANEQFQKGAVHTKFLETLGK
jgi:biotin carboxylase